MEFDWGTVPAWIATGTAIIGTGFALRQFKISSLALNLSAQSQQNQVEIARANLLLAIDREFEGAELNQSRKAVRLLRNTIETRVLHDPEGNRSPDLQKGKVARDFSKHLDSLWGKVRSPELTKSAPSSSQTSNGGGIDEYYRLMALPNWIETVGMLCARNLLPKEDVLSLYASVIYVTMFNFKNHVDARRNEQPHPNLRFMDNAYYLYQEAIEFRKIRDEPLPTRPIKSLLPWR